MQRRGILLRQLIILSDLIMLAIALLASEHGQFHLLPGMPVVLALEP